MKKSYLKYLAGLLLFGSNGVVASYIHLSSCEIVLLRSVLGAALLLGLVNTGVGCYCYFSSIGDLPAQSVAICGYLEPLSAVLLSVLILHETMAPLQILGAVLIIGGAVFGECCKV